MEAMRSGSEATGNASTSRPCIETGARRVFVFVDVLGVKPVDKVPETTNAPFAFGSGLPIPTCFHVRTSENARVIKPFTLHYAIPHLIFYLFQTAYKDEKHRI